MSEYVVEDHVREQEKAIRDLQFKVANLEGKDKYCGSITSCFGASLPNSSIPFSGEIECQLLSGHSGMHHNIGVDLQWHQWHDDQYVMEEPENIGAVVIDENGDRWVRLLPEPCWYRIGSKWGLVEFKQLDYPQPFQNCTLDSNSPEPPSGSVVLDVHGNAWQREGDSWCNGEITWRWSLLASSQPFTLVWRGGDQ